jgi:hypothetical protein
MGPLVASSNLLMGGTASAGPSLALVSGAMVAVSSSMLGIFLQGRGFYVNLLLSLGVYIAVSFATAPLAALPAVNLLGIK